MLKTLMKWIVLWLVGGLSYCLIEIAARGYTHWSMMVVGGICFLIIGALNEHIANMPLIKQMFWSMAAVTIIELFAGIIINLWLRLDVWDYSGKPFNLIGQICLQNSIYWFFLSAVAVVLDDYIRFWVFKGKKPKYKWV